MLKRRLVVVDIDGTLANNAHREHHLRGAVKDWDAFYAAQAFDTPIDNVVELLQVLIASDWYAVVYCTGREERYREVTAKWLRLNVSPRAHYAPLLMRVDSDRRPDSVIKLERLRQFMANEGYADEDVAFVIDDRDSVVAAWRAAGFTCLQPALGSF